MFFRLFSPQQKRGENVVMAVSKQELGIAFYLILFTHIRVFYLQSVHEPLQLMFSRLFKEKKE